MRSTDTFVVGVAFSPLAAGRFNVSRTPVTPARAVAARSDTVGTCSLGETASLLPALRAMTHDAPLRELPWAQLIRVLYVTGDPANALNAFNQARSVFVEALGIDPPRRLQQLQRAILNRDEKAIITRPPQAYQVPT